MNDGVNGTKTTEDEQSALQAQSSLELQVVPADSSSRSNVEAVGLERALVDAHCGAAPRGTTRLLLVDSASSQVVASALVGRATLFVGTAHVAGLSEDVLAGFYYVGRVTASQPGMDDLLRYCALRQGRLDGFQLAVVESSGDGQRPGFSAVVGAPVVDRSPAAAPPAVSRVVAAEIDQATHQLFSSLPSELQSWIAERLFADELESVVMAGCRRFHQTSFFTSTFDGTLTKDQYIESVANNHQFVRWTTRLLGRVIGITEDRELRSHYIEHFNGEIDHDVLLENDLRHLGADVEFVKRYMAPQADVLQFMGIQESASAFHRNPLWFLAVPLAIESVSAFLKQDFITALKKCIASWGVENPGRACTFLASHIHTDGGDDGHWQGTRRIIARYCRTEHDLQRMSAIARAVLGAVTRAYDYYGKRPSVSHLEQAFRAFDASAAPVRMPATANPAS